MSTGEGAHTQYLTKATSSGAPGALIRERPFWNVGAQRPGRWRLEWDKGALPMAAWGDTLHGWGDVAC